MPDTIYYNLDDTAAINKLSPEVKALIKQAEQNELEHSTGINPAIPFFLVPGILLLVVYCMVKFVKVWHEPEDNIETGNDNNDSTAGTPEYYTYEGSNLGLTEAEITNIIIKHYPFYNQLWPTVQYKFQQRLFSFIKAKSFTIYSQQPFKEMPVLTSAAAIHLTLGLDDYMLPWFKQIVIHPQAYFANGLLRILAGNVEGHTITIAWDQLLKGIKNEADGSNVGLHEMAHALYYQQAIVYNNKEVNFSANFEKVMQEGEEVYKLKDTQHLLYSDYAYRDLQEFWAESVEIFFEKPTEMQKCYPQIYDTIKDLLRQDPVNKGNPVC